MSHIVPRHRIVAQGTVGNRFLGSEKNKVSRTYVTLNRRSSDICI
jgi:hypothetical protein